MAAAINRRRALEMLCAGGASLATVPAWFESQSASKGMRAAQAAGHPRDFRPLAVIPPLFSARAHGPGSAAGIYDVRAFGAAGDGRHVDTPAINRAIAAAARDGGGAVHFPPGTYVCYSIRLQSNITLQLQPGATILAAACQALGGASNYDAPEPNPAAGHYEDFGHRHWRNALISGIGLHDVGIVGPGLIFGRGLSFGPGQKLPGMADKSIALKDCRNVTLRDFSILQGGHFGILATGVDNLTVDNLLVDTNRDGMDIDCCRNVRIARCTVNSPWDDGICLKSSYALGARRVTDNVTISDCLVTGGYRLGTVLDATFQPFPADARVPRTGRIKFGTESNGGFQNIAIANCLFDRCGGLALESVDGAWLENVAVSNIVMRGISNAPLFLRLGARLRGPAASTRVGMLRHISVENLTVHGAPGRYCSILSGIPGHPIEDVRLRNIAILADGGGSPAMSALRPAEREKDYPEPTMFGPMPAWGFFLRHVRGLDLSDVHLRVSAPDHRPAFVLEDVAEAEFFRIRAAREAGVAEMAMRDVRQIGVRMCAGIPETEITAASARELPAPVQEQ